MVNHQTIFYFHFALSLAVIPDGARARKLDFNFPDSIFNFTYSNCMVGKFHVFSSDLPCDISRSRLRH